MIKISYPLGVAGWLLWLVAWFGGWSTSTFVGLMATSVMLEAMAFPLIRKEKGQEPEGTP